MVSIDLSVFTITEIVYFISIPLEKGLVRPIKDRPRMGLVFCPSGRVIYNHHGKSYVSDPNHVLMLPTNGNYTLICKSGCICPMVDFKISPPLETPEIFSFRVPNIAGLLSIYRHIDNLWTFKKQSYKLKCMAGLYEMFSLLNDTSLSPYCPGYKFEQIRPSIDYLEANYNNPEITNNMLSTKSGISTVYFRKIFTEKYGISPMKYLQIKRIEKAKDMLLSEIGSISNVSDATGFNSIYHFSRAFHNMTGYSPTEFIREYARRAPKKVE